MTAINHGKGFAEAEFAGRDRLTVLLAALLLFGAALVFGVAADAPHVPMLAGGGLAGSLWLRRPLPRSSRSYVYLAVAVLVLVFVGDQVFDIEADRFFALPVEYFSPGLIYFGVALTLLPQRESTTAAIMAAVVFSMMLSGNMTAYGAENTAWAVTQGLLDRFPRFYAGMIFLQAWPLLWLLHRSQLPERKIEPDPGVRTGARVWLIPRLAVFALLLSMVGVWQARNLLMRYESTLQRLFVNMLRNVPGEPRGAYFGDEVDLWRTLPSRLADDRRIVLRAVGEHPPGYLRARAYDSYQRGGWRLGWRDEPRRMFEYVIDENLLSIYFSLHDWHADGNQTGDWAEARRRESGARIYPVGFRHDQYLLVPGNVLSLTAAADRVSFFPEGMFVAEGWERSVGYEYGANEPSGMSAWPEPREFEYNTDRRRYLYVSSWLRQRLQRLAEEQVFRGLPPDAGFDLVLRSLNQFYNRSFRYELNPAAAVRRSGVRRSDPVPRFLLETRRGHCELFASATALLLRLRGIPARYVVGYVCREPHPRANYWLARRRDAHAWVEAYVPEHGGWVVVETTPAGAVPSGDSGFSWVGAQWDMLLMLGRRIFAMVKEGRLAAAAFAAAGWIGRWVVRLWDGAGRWVVFFVLAAAGFAVLWLRRRRRVRRLPMGWRQLQRQRRILERRAGRLGVRRTPTMTVRELAQAIRRRTPAHAESPLPGLLERYEKLRYGTSPLTLAAVVEFKNEMRRRRLANGRKWFTVNGSFETQSRKDD